MSVTVPTAADNSYM